MPQGVFPEFTGMSGFGPAYRFMFENDSHAEGSVDRVLLERMLLLCADTRHFLYEEFTPTRSEYREGTGPRLEEIVGELNPDTSSAEDRVMAICGSCSRLSEKGTHDLNTMRLGGTEEEIIKRGSDWCTDVARVCCVLCQVAGMASRIVQLADTERAYCGHAVIEAYRDGVWGAADPTANVIYRRPDAKPASTWDLQKDHGLIEAHSRGDSTPYSNPGQFRAAAISNYFVTDSPGYDYTVSGVNDYYRSILEMSDRGWPGGLHWLHGEETVSR